MKNIDVLNEKGFFIAKGLLSEFDIFNLNNSLKQTYDNVLFYLSIKEGINLQDSMQKLFNEDNQKYLLVTSSLWRKKSVNDLLNHKKINDYVIDNFGFDDIFLPGGQVVHIMGKSLMLPGYEGISTHQDWPSVRGSLDGLIIWIPLLDINSQNFPLELIPSSNKLGMYPLKNEVNSPWEIDPNSYDENDFVALDVNVGDVVFMTYFTVHRTSKLFSGNGFRISISTRYDNGSEKTFIERSFPTAYKRIVDRLLK